MHLSGGAGRQAWWLAWPLLREGAGTCRRCSCPAHGGQAQGIAPRHSMAGPPSGELRPSQPPLPWLPALLQGASWAGCRYPADSHTMRCGGGTRSMYAVPARVPSCSWPSQAWSWWVAMPCYARSAQGCLCSWPPSPCGWVQMQVQGLAALPFGRAGPGSAGPQAPAAASRPDLCASRAWNCAGHGERRHRGGGRGSCATPAGAPLLNRLVSCALCCAAGQGAAPLHPGGAHQHAGSHPGRQALGAAAQPGEGEGGGQGRAGRG